jgi:hypothetical protein
VQKEFGQFYCNFFSFNLQIVNFVLLKVLRTLIARNLRVTNHINTSTQPSTHQHMAHRCVIECADDCVDDCVDEYVDECVDACADAC